MNCAPALACEIGRDKQIAWEQRRSDSFAPAGVTAALAIARQISAETLTLEVLRRPGFRVRPALHHIPALAGGGIHHAASLLLRSPSSEGASTRSGPSRAATPAKVLAAVVRSVTIAPSTLSAILSKD